MVFYTLHMHINKNKNRTLLINGLEFFQTEVFTGRKHTYYGFM